MKLLAIDVGNVICKMTPEAFVLKLSEIAGISEEKAWNFFRLGTAEHDLGHISIRDQMMRELGITSYASDYLIKNFWNPMLQIDTDVMDFLLRHLNFGGQISILSNMGKEHFEMMQEKLAPIYNYGNQIFKHYSCVVGARKPSKLFYQSFLADRPEWKGCLYVDDLLENIETGREMGFESLQFSVWDENKVEKLNDLEKKIRS